MGHGDFALALDHLYYFVVFFECQNLEHTNIFGTEPQFILKTYIK